jgi:hypothetical protein
VQHSKAEKLTLLQFCIERLDLTDRERGLLRQVHMSISNERPLDASLRDEVGALLKRCRELTGYVSQP